MVNKYELIFGTDVQLILALCAFILVLTIIGFIFDEDTSPQIVILVGIMLILVSALALIYIDSMRLIIDEFHTKKLISESFYLDFKKKTNIFLFVFPFVSAAIGTNLISDVITKKLHYNKPLTVLSVLKSVPIFLKILFGFILIPIVVPIIILSLIFSKCYSTLPNVLRLIKSVNRHLYLKLLKFDIILRNVGSNDKD